MPAALIENSDRRSAPLLQPLLKTTKLSSYVLSPSDDPTVPSRKYLAAGCRGLKPSGDKIHTGAANSSRMDAD